MDRSSADSAQHQKRLRHHNRELSILNRIAEALNREVDLPRALQTALENIVQIFDVRTGWIYLLNEDGDKFYTAATLNLPPALSDHPRRMGGTCYCLDTYLEGDMEGAANINAITCTRLKDLKKGTRGLKYHASIPLYAKDKKLGVLNVVGKDWRELSDDNLRLLHTVGDLMSIAIERARLFQNSAAIGAANERNRLAREIHDTIAQGLAAIALQLETADALMETGASKEKVQEMILNALKLTRTNLEEARRSVLDLRAAPLEGKTLPEALKTLLDGYSGHETLKTCCEVIDSGPPLPVRTAVGLYRIAQEAINNVNQHANATSLTIKLIILPQSVQLIVEDDGYGFDPLAIPEGHFGLIGLNERAKLLGGELSIRSTPGVGTVVDVKVSLEEKHE